jgi:hypothetical protein
MSNNVSSSSTEFQVSIETVFIDWGGVLVPRRLFIVGPVKAKEGESLVQCQAR